VNSTSSLAVFYVEQVALNRHVTPQIAAPLFMIEAETVVKLKVKTQQVTLFPYGASNALQDNEFL
jgi:hypothetical protein